MEDLTLYFLWYKHIFLQSSTVSIKYVVHVYIKKRGMQFYGNMYAFDLCIRKHCILLLWVVDFILQDYLLLLESSENKVSCHALIDLCTLIHFF